MDDFFTSEEKKELFSLYRHLLQSAGDTIFWRDCQKLKKHLIKAAQCNGLQRNNFGMNPVIRDLQTAVIVAEEIGMKGSCLIGIMLHEIVKAHILSIEDVNTEYGEDVGSIIKGLVKTNELYSKSPAIDSENFRNLLLSFAEDIRVILIMIADRVNIMRQIKDTGNEEDRVKVAIEAAYLYAPLAHKLGLYKLKSELEDLSLKYTQRETYYFIKEKLNETKASRDKYIASFIDPIQKKVKEAGLKFDIKGRTKSIHSIWNKIQKQKTPFEGIYDLFAIRIILDSEPDPAKEKQECWQVYSIVTDMYQPNPKRLRDWLSIPKSNGYESLHITVMGPEGRWVEVQISTRRMDEIAERGLAAHWRYKGIKGETGLDEWLTSVREALENADNDSLKVMDQFKMDLYEDEVFVFTPKGDLFKLAKGATVLDFAFHIHSKLGCKCIGAKVNHRLVPLSHQLASGDQVEILTSRSQNPQPEWLNFVTTARARARIDAYLKRIRKEAAKEGEIKEIVAFKRNNLEANTYNIDKISMYYGFSKREEFYYAVEKGDVILPENIHKLLKEKTDNVLFKYVKQALRVATKATTGKKEEEEQPKEKPKYDKKKPYILKEEAFERNYVIADCCKPIPGDESLGFINDDGNVVVHKRSCPIAMRLKSSFGERILNTEWSSHHSSFEATLEIKGIDSIGVLNTITRTISDDFNVKIIRLLIEAKDGVFEGKVKMKVHDVEDIQRMCVVLSKIKNIQSVARVAD